MCQQYRNLYFFTTLLLLGGIGKAIYGYLQWCGFAPSNHHLYKFASSLQNPGPYSVFLTILLPLALWQMLESKVDDRYFSLVSTHMGWTLVCLCIPLFLAALSRASWLAISKGCTLVLTKHYRFYFRFQQFFRQRCKQAIGCIILACLLLGAVGYSVYYLKKDSANGRLLMWNVTTRIIAEIPLTGIGWSKITDAYGETQAACFASGKAMSQEEYIVGSPEYAFNEFLQMTAETDIIGLLFFLVIAIIYICAYKTWSIGVIGSLTAWLTFACFSNPFSKPQFTLLFFLLLVMSIAPYLLTKQKGRYNKCKISILCLGATSSLPTLAWLGNRKIQNREVEERWRDEQSHYNMAIYEEIVDNYRNLYPAQRNNPRFLFEYSQCLSKIGIYEESNRILRGGAEFSSDPMFWNIIGKNHQAMGDYKQAEKCFQYASLMVPHRLYPIYFFANLYFESNDIEKALQTAHRVIEKRPEVMSAAINEMKEK